MPLPSLPNDSEKLTLIWFIKYHKSINILLKPLICNAIKSLYCHYDLYPHKNISKNKQ